MTYGIWKYSSNQAGSFVWEKAYRHLIIKEYFMQPDMFVHIACIERMW